VLTDCRFYLTRDYWDLLRDKTTEREIRHELMALKEGKSQGVTQLDDAYQQTLNRIKQQLPHRAALAKEILMWLAHARRGLTVTELQHALATKSLQRAVSTSDLLDDNELLAVCAGLVIIDRSTNIVRLAQNSVREYLKLRSSELLSSTEQDIARTCLDYLSFNTSTEWNYTQWQELEEWLTSYPFYHYAATNWGHHARESSLPRQELMGFFDDRSTVKNSIAVLMIDESSRAPTYLEDPPKPGSVTSLHLAAYFRLKDLVTELLSTAIDSDPGDSQGRTPLSYAAGLGFGEIVSLFLEAGAETDSRGLEEHANTEESSWAYTEYGGHAGRTPLSFAAEYGHGNTSKMLLNYGADPGSQCSRYHYQGWTPLLFAVRHGHQNVVSLLLENGADPEQPSMNEEDFEKPPLSHAVEEGHTNIARMLLKQGVNTEPTITSTDPDITRHTSLWLAAFRGHEAVIELLLDTCKVQLDLQDTFGRTILSYMAEQGPETMVRLIVTNGANVNIQDNARRTPLSYAAEAGHPEVVRVLLERGADQYVEDNKGETPRSRAIRNGNLEVIAVFEEIS
jgi:ankyrin repeat protein